MNFNRHTLNLTHIATFPQNRNVQNNSPVRNNTPIRPRNLSPDFEAVRSVFNEAIEVMELLKDKLSDLGLKENDYLKFTNAMKKLHNQNNLTKDNLDAEIKELLKTSPGQKKQEFLSEYNRILGA